MPGHILYIKETPGDRCVVCLVSKKYLVETEEGAAKPAAPVEPGIRASNEGSR